ncbi:MAG TPA: lyase family protein, partial [Planctomycetota bacterium]|nr:lyase family protein [Planctomycetota bacterium]
LHDFADQSWEQVKTGRTHLMDAMPIRFGQEFRGYAQQVEQGMLRVQQALDGLRQLPLGGTAVGTGVNSKPGFAARMCEVIAQEYGYLVQESEQHFHAQACLDAVVQASGALRTFATGFYKFTNDVRWMSSSSLGELAIPAVQPGSSIMPAKVNPVICESVLMVCGQVLGNDVAVAFGNSQGQFELNTMMPFMARNAVESATLLANACMVFRTRCLAGMRVTDVATGAVHKNPILATALNAKIGYEAAAKLAKEAAASGKTIQELARTRTSLDAATLATLLDPARLCGEWGRSR